MVLHKYEYKEARMVCCMVQNEIRGSLRSKRDGFSKLPLVVLINNISKYFIIKFSTVQVTARAIKIKWGLWAVGKCLGARYSY